MGEPAGGRLGNVTVRVRGGELGSAGFLASLRGDDGSAGLRKARGVEFAVGAAEAPRPVGERNHAGGPGVGACSWRGWRVKILRAQ